MTTSADAGPSIAALRAVHDRLAALAKGLDDSDVGRTSMATEWTVAQVFSHLGSGAELASAWLHAAVDHVEAPPQEAMQAVWDEWNARSPEEQVRRAVEANDAHLSALEALTAEQLADAHIVLFGGMLDLDGAGLALTRLSEAALHTWDIHASLEPGARITPEAVPLVVDSLSPWLAKPQPKAFTLTVVATAPDRVLRLTAGPGGARLAPAADGAQDSDGRLRLTSEALVRLAYGRLHDADTDGAVLTSGTVTLDDVRASFPGV